MDDGEPAVAEVSQGACGEEPDEELCMIIEPTRGTRSRSGCRALKAKAALEEQPLSHYLLVELEQLATRPGCRASMGD